MLGCRAERERQLREKVRQHAEQVRERRARPADNPADDMRAAQRELEIVSSGRPCFRSIRTAATERYVVLLKIVLYAVVSRIYFYYAPAEGSLSDDACLTSV